MTSITVEVPEYIALDQKNPAYVSGRMVHPQALGFALGRIVDELARYGLSECLLSPEAKT